MERKTEEQSGPYSGDRFAYSEDRFAYSGDRWLFSVSPAPLVT